MWAPLYCARHQLPRVRDRHPACVHLAGESRQGNGCGLERGWTRVRSWSAMSWPDTGERQEASTQDSSLHWDARESRSRTRDNGELH
jgi:hypothetical protein